MLVKFKYPLIGIIIGAVAGYAYYYFVGCASGTCPITSKPLNSTMYGAIMGALIFTGFQTNNLDKQTDKKNEKQENDN